jgi:hypothetical protein
MWITIKQVGRALARGDADLPDLRGQARLGDATRFCTSTCAVSRSVPSWNVTVIETLPSLVHCEDM